jgi:Domain of unknown function (DUF5615)
LRFLLDEDVPRPVGDFLLDRGHAVFLVEDALVNGSADTLLAQWVHVNRGIVVTFNHKHFAALVSRVPLGGRERFRKASRLSLRCKQTRALQRVTAHIESIEFEYEQCQQRPDKRFMGEIGDSYFTTNR